MKLIKGSVLCLTIAMACQFSACSKSSSKKSDASAVVTGGEACNEIVAVDHKYADITQKEVELVKENPADLERARLMIAEMEQIAEKYQDFDCVIAHEGESAEYTREDLVINIEDSKRLFGF